MSRTRLSAVAAAAALAVALTAAPAQAADKPAITSPGSVGSVVGGGATTQGIWTWVCQIILNACK